MEKVEIIVGHNQYGQKMIWVFRDVSEFSRPSSDEARFILRSATQVIAVHLPASGASERRAEDVVRFLASKAEVKSCDISKI